MKLVIFRHGTAEPWRNDDSDEARALTEYGRSEVQRQRDVLSPIFTPKSIWVSPYQRTQETAQLLLPVDQNFETTRVLVPESPPLVVIDSLTEVQQDLLLVSHQPLVSQLIAKLSARAPYDCPMMPASFAVLEGDVFATGCMTLTGIFHSSGDVTR